ncbi:MAG: YbaB/EbfC family nucleoid-associated protein [Ignavibacteria bacterium]|nr:YbaB/EbfC family nucleoid-associated protein [Ignavibacteria bacterium]
MKPNLQGMLKQVQKMQEEMERVQQELSEKVITEESGGGLVKITMNGKKEVVNITLEKEIIDPSDPSILEDLLIAAFNKAIASATKMSEEELGKVTKGMLPPGMNIPGF